MGDFRYKWPVGLVGEFVSSDFFVLMEVTGEPDESRESCDKCGLQSGPAHVQQLAYLLPLLLWRGHQP